MLTGILRNEWNFNGHVVSDDGAIENVVNRHKYLKNYTAASAACINAGCNLELGSTAYQNITSAVKAQLLTEEKVRYILRNLTFKTNDGTVIQNPNRSKQEGLNSSNNDLLWM